MSKHPEQPSEENDQPTPRELVEQMIAKNYMKIWYDEDGSLHGEMYEPAGRPGAVLTYHMMVDKDGQFTGSAVRFPVENVLRVEVTEACNQHALELLDELTQP